MCPDLKENKYVDYIGLNTIYSFFTSSLMSGVLYESMLTPLARGAKGAVESPRIQIIFF